MRYNTRKCNACGQNAQLLYTAEFRIGETSGGWKLFFGEWAELGESMIPMNVYVCPNCGKVELYATEKMMQEAIQAAQGK